MKRKLIYITILGIILGFSLYVMRGTDISNKLKRIILPELEMATGQKVIAQKIYINLFPLYIGIKDVKAFDDKGVKFFAAKNIKGYISISGLLKKEIVIRRTIIKEPEIVSDRSQIEEMVSNIKNYLNMETRFPYKVVFKSIVISNAFIDFQEGDNKLTIKALNADLDLSERSSFRISSKEINFKKEGFPKVKGMIETFFILKDKEIELKKLAIISDGTEVTADGSILLEKLTAELRTETNILIKTIKSIFALKKDDRGSIFAKGIIRFEDLKSDINNIFLELKLKGDMQLETLMELLHVHERLNGYLVFDGEIKGYINDLKGNAKARLSDGNLFGIDVNKLSCNVSYSDGIMKFTNGSANLYKGKASVEAMIEIPVVNYYSFKVIAENVNSKDVFKLINWDPGIAEGKVSGEIASSGSTFNPYGRFLYRNTSLKNLVNNGDLNILGRINEIKGEFAMKDNIINFPNLTVTTDRSTATANGDVDILNNLLNFTGSGKTEDIKELSSPYFTAINGSGNFQYILKGKFEDPTIEMKFISYDAIFSTKSLNLDILNDRKFNFQKVSWDLSYKKNLLNTKKFQALSDKEEFRAKGNIFFPNAQGLFDLREPDYDLNISIKNSNIKKISNTFKDSPSFEGCLDTDFRLFGKPDDIRASGIFSAKGFSLEKYVIDFVSGKSSYEKGKFSFSDVKIRKRDALVNMNGIIFLDKKFLFFADSTEINISDIIDNLNIISTAIQHPSVKNSKLKNIKIKGEGTFENPYIEIISDIMGGAFKGHSLGKGRLFAKLKDNRLEVDASILEGKLSMNGVAELTEKIPWNAKVKILPARYDFLIESLLKDVPEDLLFNFSGNITATGDKDHIKATANINRAHINLFGIGFTNSSDIRLNLQNRRLSIDPFGMKNDAVEFRISGNMTIGKNYDLLLEGTSSLTPLKALSKNIDLIRGDTVFVFNVSGDWDRPRIYGGMDVINANIGFKDIPYRFGSVNAYLYVDEDRIIIEKASCRFAGGDISLSGTAYIEKFKLKRFLFESRINNVTTSLSKDFWLNFDGNLYFKGTRESHNIFGDIHVKKAKYGENIDLVALIMKARPNERKTMEREVSTIFKTGLNVRIHGDNLLIDNNIARSSMKMDVILRGTINNPTLLGKLETNEGMVYFRNNDFRIIKASFNFFDPATINPYFDVLAETSIRNYNIRLNLTGTADQFNLALSSSPNLNESDIFALLTVGQLGKDIRGIEGGIGATEAASFLAGQFQKVAEERIRTIIGFDRVKIEPYVLKTTGATAPMVSVSKRLLGDRLYATYSASIGTAEEHILKLEYNLTPNVSIVGLRDERGSVGGDIKFRFEFK